MVNLISILLTGGFAGWAASLLMRMRISVWGGIVTGIVGALLGGFLISPLLGAGSITQSDFNLPAMLVSFLGSLIFLGIMRAAGPLFKEAATSVRPPKALSIFISYRREDSADVVGRIYDRLVQSFGKKNVFKDVDSIPIGADFRKHLNKTVGQCSVFLVVIGRHWMGDVPGASRLDDQGDFVRIELEVAFQRDIPIVPLILQGASMPSEHELPPVLQGLVYRQGIAIRPDPDFHRDMDRLIEGMELYSK